MALGGVTRIPADRYGEEAGSGKAARGLLPSILLLACVALSLLICAGLLVYGSGRGLDLTDEIFYLIWARDPNAYALIYQPFGYLLHPLFDLARSNLHTYRLAGFTIAAGAGAYLGYCLSFSEDRRLLFSLQGAVSALTIFFPWIVTPSYNSAANVGAMLAIAGILNCRMAGPQRQISGAMAGAAGLCISAFSKPPLFAISGGLILGLAMVTRNARSRISLFAALILGALLVSLFISPAQIPPLVRRIVTTQQVLSLPNKPLELPVKIMRDWLIVPQLLTPAVIAAFLSLAAWRSDWSKACGYVAVVVSLFYLGSIVPDAIDGSIPDFLGLTLVTCAAGYAGVVRVDRKLPLLPILLLLGAPVAVALGTFNNQWAQLNFSMTFPFLALFLLASADPLLWRKGMALALAIIGPIAVMVLAAWYPYSLQDSVFEQQISIEQPITHEPILVDEDTATFVSSAQGAAKGALLIDLSGTGPGVAAVLGARAPVLPWLNPATATWPDVVWSRLNPQEQENAWFVAPILPLFGHSAPAKWLVAHRTQFCRNAIPPMTFWGVERTLEVWRPCSKIGRASQLPQATSK